MSVAWIDLFRGGTRRAARHEDNGDTRTALLGQPRTRLLKSFLSLGSGGDAERGGGGFRM